MPRASNYLLEGYTYHLTQRCHGREFLLKAGQDRDAYRAWLREGVLRFKVPVYGFCVTRNHVHVVVHAVDREAVASLMHLASGATAKSFNVRKERHGSLWLHPYHCTVIQDGQHLLNCLRYVDMNMVRAGCVSHPRQWTWCGYHELAGNRRRYKILNVEHLVERLQMGSVSAFQQLYAESIEERLACGKHEREDYWTSSLAVGNKDFVNGITSRYRNRYDFTTEIAGDGAWTVRERPSSYIK